VILFWDKNTPKTIPQALRTLKVPLAGIHHYLERFPLSDNLPEGGDDRWLSEVGKWGWVVISQDYHLHERENERYALKQHNIGCFYLWGAEAPKWEIMRCFARAYDKIIEAADNTPRPYIYRVSRMGKLIPQPIP
jgi:hypothetical protein